MSVTIEPIKPLVGGKVTVDRAHLTDPEVVEAIKTALEERGVLVARLLKQHPHLAELMPERLRKARDSPLPLKRDLRAGTPRAGLGASGGL